MASEYGSQNGKSKPVGKPSPLVPSYDADFRAYINLDLREADKAHFADWWTTDEPFLQLDASVSDGVALSLKVDPRAQGFLASATQRRKGSPNAGLVVTARAKTAGLAFGRLLFCLYILSAKERWEDTQPVADPDRW